MARPPVSQPESDLGFAMLLGVLLERWRLVAGATTLVTLLGLLHAYLATPIYRADALVQVEEKAGAMEGLEELTSMFTGETLAEAEMELIRSRWVVGSVVEQLRLDVVAEPRYVPLLGRALARRHGGGAAVADPFPGLAQFAWGGERIRVQRLDTPEALEGRPLTLVAGEGGRYAVLGPDEGLLLEGEVGRVASLPPADVRGDAPSQGLELFVSELRARPGTHFRLMKVPRIAAIRQLQGQLKVSERGKKTGMMQLTLDGPDRERIVAALDAITDAYVRQNVERKSAEAEKTLEFVTGQLPVLKQNLEAAEAALNAFRTRSGSVDLGLEAEAIIERAAEAEKRGTELEFQYAELRQRFKESHPALVALRKKMGQVRAERGAVEERMKTLPAAELASARLMRDVKVSSELYLLLLNRAQELRVVKSGAVGNVRTIDAAELQEQRVAPQRGRIALSSLLLGAVLGVAAVFLQRALFRGEEDPDRLEQGLGVSVYASIPHSEKQEEADRAVARGRRAALAPLAVLEPDGLAVESLRSLRTSLQFALAEGRSSVVAIGGPRPGVGKTFVSVNLAHVLADTGKRVLLVDADLRKGRLHRYFGQERGMGLSELIRGGAELDEALRPGPTANLAFIATGAIPSNPSELLASTRFRQLVQELSQRFDLTLLDAPPVLAVTDAILIAQVAGVNLLVLRSGLHPMREMALAVSRMRKSGVQPNGLVINDVPVRTGLYGAGKYGYHYQYEYK